MESVKPKIIIKQLQQVVQLAYISNCEFVQTEGTTLCGHHDEVLLIPHTSIITIDKYHSHDENKLFEINKNKLFLSISFSHTLQLTFVSFLFLLFFFSLLFRSFLLLLLLLL